MCQLQPLRQLREKVAGLCQRAQCLVAQGKDTYIQLCRLLSPRAGEVGLS